MNIIELFSARSTNGQRGLSLVGPSGVTLPARGALRHVGNVAGAVTYEFTPGESTTWVLVGGDVTVHGGATLAASVDLQSSQVASLVLLGPQAVVEHHGYKRRSSRIVAYAEGGEIDIPAPVLAAMGLLQATGTIAPVEAPRPLGGSMAAAFAALRGN